MDYQHAISVQGLAKKYPRFQFGPTTFDLSVGYVYGMVGPNGAGKTTLLKMLMSLVQPTSGSIKVFGLDSRVHEKQIKQRIGFVPESSFLYQNMNAHWFGQFTRAHYATWSDEYYQQLLVRFGIDASGPAKALSRGTRVKLQLALALAHRPELLILDEPTSGLDPLIRREMLNQLGEVVQDEKRTVLFSTHITEDVERIADYIIFMVDGQMALVEQREVLRDQWHEIMVDLQDVSQLPGMMSVKDTDNAVQRVVVSDAAGALSFLQRIGKKPLHQRPLGLDEILAELVASSKAHEASKAVR